MSTKTVVSILGALLLMSLSSLSAFAKDYPTRPIDLYTPMSAGGAIDFEARLIARITEKYIGQPIVVTNKPGAAGTICAGQIVNSAPDGYSVALLFNTLHALIVKTQEVPFDPQDMVPLVNLIEFKDGLMVRGDSPWKNLDDLLEYAKKNPGKLRWGFTGRGTLLHIWGRMMFKKVGAETIEVPYKGGPELLTATLGGHLDAFITQYGVIAEQAKAGLFRCLVFYSDKRYSEPSNVPSALELGFPEAASLKVLLGIYVHKKTPENVKKILFEAFKKTFEDPEFKAGIKKIGDEPRFGGPEFITESITTVEKIGVPFLKELGLYVGK